MAAMTRLSLTLNPMGISHFHLLFLNPQNRFEPRFAGMFIGKKIFLNFDQSEHIIGPDSHLGFPISAKKEILYMTIQ
jgi:hypothetical protein